MAVAKSGLRCLAAPCSPLEEQSGPVLEVAFLATSSQKTQLPDMGGAKSGLRCLAAPCSPLEEQSGPVLEVAFLATSSPSDRLAAVGGPHWPVGQTCVPPTACSLFCCQLHAALSCQDALAACSPDCKIDRLPAGGGQHWPGGRTCCPPPACSLVSHSQPVDSRCRPQPRRPGGVILALLASTRSTAVLG
jgi:hypothetical protein